MPTAPKHPCAEPGCPQLVERGKSRCDQHRYTNRAPFAGAQRAAERNGPNLYWTQDWRKLRAEWLAYEPLCRLCGAEATVVDHYPEHDGSREQFFDRTRLRSLCDPCHRTVTARQVAARRGQKPTG